MKTTYARCVLWLIRPALELREVQKRLEYANAVVDIGTAAIYSSLADAAAAGMNALTSATADSILKAAGYAAPKAPPSPQQPGDEGCESSLPKTPNRPTPGSGPACAESESSCESLSEWRLVQVLKVENPGWFALLRSSAEPAQAPQPSTAAPASPQNPSSPSAAEPGKELGGLA